MATKQKSAICVILSALLLTMIFIGCGEENKMTLPIELQIRIRQDYFNQFVIPTGPWEFDEVVIEKVYGKFEGFIVVRFSQTVGWPGPWEMEIGGVMFDGCLAWRTIAWKDGQILRIADAFENGILSKTDIQNIANLSQN